MANLSPGWKVEQLSRLLCQCMDQDPDMAMVMVTPKAKTFLGAYALTDTSQDVAWTRCIPLARAILEILEKH